MMEETLFNFPLQQAGHVGSSEGLMARLSFIDVSIISGVRFKAYQLSAF